MPTICKCILEISPQDRFVIFMILDIGLILLMVIYVYKWSHGRDLTNQRRQHSDRTNQRAEAGQRRHFHTGVFINITKTPEFITLKY